MKIDYFMYMTRTLTYWHSFCHVYIYVVKELVKCQINNRLEIDNASEPVYCRQYVTHLVNVLSEL